jgi:putative DNA primase/helicase
MSSRYAIANPASTFEREQVEWLEPSRIPLGAVTLVVGDPGLGKSAYTTGLAAKLSQAGMTSLICTAEDSLTATVRPRLEAASADLEQIGFVQMKGEDGYEDGLYLPDDVLELDACVRDWEARLVVVDPLTAFLPSDVNSWRDQSVRGAVAPLRALAERHRCAVVVVAHLNKGASADPLRRTGGSIGLPAAARSALLLARDPEDPDGPEGRRRVLAHWKSNLSELAPSLLLELEPIVLAALNGYPDVKTIRMRELGESAHNGETLLAVRGDAQERGALEDAKAFLHDELSDGRRVSAATVQKRASAAGISPRTLDRAKAELGIRSKKDGFEGGWAWALPEERIAHEVRQRPDVKPRESTKDAKDAYIKDVALLADKGRFCDGCESQAECERSGCRTVARLAECSVAGW